MNRYIAAVLRKILPERQRNGTKEGGSNDCIIRPLLENSARSSCSEYAILALGSTFVERGLTFHLRTPRVGLPFLPFSLFLSFSNCMALFVITACVMRAGQNGIADKSQGTNRRDQPDKVWLDIRAYESNNLTPSLFSRDSRDWRVLRLLPFLWSSSPPAIRFPSRQQPAEEHGGLRGVRRGGRSSKYFRGRKEATSVTLPRVCSAGDENNAR